MMESKSGFGPCPGGRPARALYIATFGHGFYVLPLPGGTAPAVPAAPGTRDNGQARNLRAIP
jgi:hypothetical protein